jgi:hypothetical protein
VSPTQPSITVDVQVTTPSGTSAAVAADRFNYWPTAPTITGLGTTSGPAAGGTSVVITGTGFSSINHVYFGAVAASYTVNSTTQITATSPAQAAGPVDITVAAAGGTSALRSADVFTYLGPAPAVTGITPSSGSTAGGTSITISGSGFTGATNVLFGANAALTYTVNSDTSITALSPLAAAGTIDVTVTTGNGTSATGSADHFSYTADSGTPAISGISPSTGPTSGGTTVIISGTNLTGATEVLFGTAAAPSFTVVSATEIDASSPLLAAGTVDITVVTFGGISSTSSADQFTAQSVLPTVSGLSQNTGSTAGGTTISLTGTHFTGTSVVTFGSVPTYAFSVTSDTSMTVVTPANAAGTFDVTVTTPSGTSATSGADHFTYNGDGNVPAVSGVSPTSGPTGGGTSVTITGSNFNNVAAVWFGNVLAPSFTVTSPTSITATSPYTQSGTIDVTVSSADGISATGSADHFGYTATAPSVASISPNSGPAVGGAQVVITGVNFNGATQVLFGATAATSFTITNATQIVATEPALALGTFHVTVTTPYGTSATSSADQFTALAMPTVTGVNASSGTWLGGTQVTITGTNFTAPLAVSFGGIAASAVTINSASQLTVTTPAGSPGTYDVTVTTSNGTSATSTADQFTFIEPPAVVTGLGPTYIAYNQTVEVIISGTGFSNATAVYFGTLPATSVSVSSDTQITCISPVLGANNPAGTVDVTVVTPTGTSLPVTADQFAFYGRPAVTGVSPNSGSTSGGTVVTISGQYFTGAGSVYFGSTAASSFTINSDSVITATSPAESTGTVDVTVSNFYFGSNTSAADQFTFGGSPQDFAGVPHRIASSAGLTSAQLQPIVAEAIAGLQAAGFNAGVLKSATFHIADLPGALLGLTNGNNIWIDRTAAGQGWYLGGRGSTAFAQQLAAREFQADASSAAFGHVDLLTVVTHELGHVLGFASVNPMLKGHDWMTATLATGMRRLPDPAAVVQPIIIPLNPRVPLPAAAKSAVPQFPSAPPERGGFFEADGYLLASRPIEENGGSRAAFCADDDYLGSADLNGGADLLLGESATLHVAAGTAADLIASVFFQESNTR